VSGRERPRSGDVRTQRRCTRRGQDAQDVEVLVRMASGWMVLSNPKSGPNVGSTSRPDSPLLFGCQVRQTHRTHRTLVILFADACSHCNCLFLLPDSILLSQVGFLCGGGCTRWLLGCGSDCFLVVGFGYVLTCLAPGLEWLSPTPVGLFNCRWGGFCKKVFFIPWGFTRGYLLARLVL